MDTTTNKNTFLLDVEYKQYKNESLCLDIYLPSNDSTNRPVFVYIHGGGFLWYDKTLVDADHRINHVKYRDTLLDHGFAFISVEYRKEKMTEYPCLIGQIEDVKDAIIWIKQHAKDYGLNPQNMGLWGLSAGGALALAAALNPDENYNLSSDTITSEVSYVIDFYGITDIVNFYKLHKLSEVDLEEFEKIQDLVYRHANVRVTNEHDIDAVKQVVDPHSPIYNITPNNLFISIYHGTEDHQVDFEANAKEFYNKSLSCGNDVTLHTYENKDHGFWWDTKAFYDALQDAVIKDVLTFSSKSQNNI